MIVSYVVPRALVALGLPLDAWIVKSMGYLTLAITNDAALWLATLIVFVILFFIILWLDHRPKTSAKIVNETSGQLPASDFISLVELRDIIKSDPSWNLQAGLQYLDLQKSFRESAHRQEFEVWGRQHSSSVFVKEQILSKIPHTYWLEGTLDLMRLANANENETIVTRVLDIQLRRTEPIYFDLEVSRREALHWIKNGAARYRGQADAERSKNLGLDA